MRNTVLLLIALFLAGCSSPPADVNGHWSGAVDLTAVVTTCQLELKQEGDKLTGKYNAFEASSQTPFSGELTGTVSGEGVELELQLSDKIKESRAWTSMSMSLVVGEQDGEKTLGGWTTRYTGEKKQVLETLFTPGR